MGGGGGGESESAYSVFIPTGTPSLCYHYQTSVQIGVNLGERQILISVSYSRNFPGIDSVSRMNSVCWGSLWRREILMWMHNCTVIQNLYIIADQNYGCWVLLRPCNSLFLFWSFDFILYIFLMKIRRNEKKKNLLVRIPYISNSDFSVMSDNRTQNHMPTYQLLD